MTALAVARPAPDRAARPAFAAVQRKCACGGTASALTGECEDCQRKKAFGLQTKPAHGGAANGAGWDSIVADGLASPGAPLPPATRGFFERRFGQDFSAVRIHADRTAAASARALKAHAYTSGRHIVFAAGRYDATSAGGLGLIAHELTHVLQQRSGRRAADGSGTAAAAEREADANAARLPTGEVLSFAERAPAVSRRAVGETTTTVQEPASPPGCDLRQHRAIEPAVYAAQARLRRAVERVDAYIAAPTAAENSPVRAAFERHFHSTDPAVVARVRTRLDTIRTDMTTRTPFTVECHDESDTSCGNSGAYVVNPNLLVFCPGFFNQSAAWRIGALIHEMAHALTGLRITDRAYSSDRLLPYLSTAEALDNAESYEMFAREVESGRAVTGAPVQDDVDDCSERTEPLIREAIARAQRWNRDAENIANDQRAGMLAASAGFFSTHLGDATPATRATARRVFGSMVVRLGSPIEVRCDNASSAECSATRRAYKGSARNTARGAGLGAKIGGGLGAAIGRGAGAGPAAGGSALLGLGIFGLSALGGLALGALIGLVVGALTRRPQVRVCPDWASLPTLEDRTESLLAAIYETYGNVDGARSRRYAALARALHAHWWPAPPA
jgi:hypothetical protein